MSYKEMEKKSSDKDVLDAIQKIKSLGKVYSEFIKKVHELPELELEDLLIRSNRSEEIAKAVLRQAFDKFEHRLADFPPNDASENAVIDAMIMFAKISNSK